MEPSLKAAGLKPWGESRNEELLDHFLTFLELQAQAEESGALDKNPNPTQGTSGESKWNQKEGGKSSAFTIDTKMVCMWDGKEHATSECPHPPEPKKGSKMIIEAGGCVACLQPGHKARTCTAKKACGVDGCKGFHHPLVHYKVTGTSATTK